MNCPECGNEEMIEDQRPPNVIYYCTDCGHMFEDEDQPSDWDDDDE